MGIIFRLKQCKQHLLGVDTAQKTLKNRTASMFKIRRCFGNANAQGGGGWRSRRTNAPGCMVGALYLRGCEWIYIDQLCAEMLCVAWFCPLVRGFPKSGIVTNSVEETSIMSISGDGKCVEWFLGRCQGLGLGTARACVAHQIVASLSDRRLRYICGISS